MDKLIGMTDFVLWHAENFNFNTDDLYSFNDVINYANFLKQPLTLGMFVPCDADGNIMEEPVNYNIWGELHYNNGENNGTIGFEDHLKYQEAKDRVLFEGKPNVRTTGNPYIRLKNIEFHLYGLTIERLVTFELILTESAKKQIGL